MAKHNPYRIGLRPLFQFYSQEQGDWLKIATYAPPFAKTELTSTRDVKITFYQSTLFKLLYTSVLRSVDKSVSAVQRLRSLTPKRLLWMQVQLMSASSPDTTCGWSWVFSQGFARFRPTIMMVAFL